MEPSGPELSRADPNGAERTRTYPRPDRAPPAPRGPRGTGTTAAGDGGAGGGLVLRDGRGEEEEWRERGDGGKGKGEKREMGER